MVERLRCNLEGNSLDSAILIDSANCHFSGALIDILSIAMLDNLLVCSFSERFLLAADIDGNENLLFSCVGIDL